MSKHSWQRKVIADCPVCGGELATMPGIDSDVLVCSQDPSHIFPEETHSDATDDDTRDQ